MEEERQLRPEVFERKKRAVLGSLRQGRGGGGERGWGGGGGGGGEVGGGVVIFRLGRQRWPLNEDF